MQAHIRTIAIKRKQCSKIWQKQRKARSPFPNRNGVSNNMMPASIRVMDLDEFVMQKEEVRRQERRGKRERGAIVAHGGLPAADPMAR